MNNLLLRLTAAMPMKQINLDKFINVAISDNITETICIQSPYIQRYYAGTFRDGSDLWLHRFLSAEGDRHLHSHPFEFESIILHGGYTEEFIDIDGSKKTRESLPSPDSKLPELIDEVFIYGLGMYSATFLSMARGANQSLDVYDWHRIASVLPETWTAVIVNPKRLPKWFFKDDDGELSDKLSSPRDWWKDYKVRPECGIAGDDNRV